jgi:hypothetical protein
MAEFITVEIESYKWEALKNECFLENEIDYKVKIVKIKDDFFKDDDIYKVLKSRADKAYKELEEYQFKKRHKI